MIDRISVVILTKNSERLLKEVLQALKPIDEVVILDNGSNDSTLSIANDFQNVSIHTHPFMGFGAMKQLGASLAKHDWILSIDSDEVLSKELLEELKNTSLQDEYVYSYEVKNYYQGVHIRCCGWDKDRFIGIYNKKYANFDNSEVHEKIISLTKKPLQEICLKGHINHYPFESAEAFIHKMQRYAQLYAKQHEGKKTSSAKKAFTHALWCFIKNYFFQKGFLYGYRGFLIASYNAQSAFWKYILLYEANMKLTKEQQEDQKEHNKT